MKWKIAIIAIVLGCMALAEAFWTGLAPKSVLADGTTIALSSVEVGFTNFFEHGTLLSKTLGRLAPTSGIAIAGFRLERPNRFSLVPDHGVSIVDLKLDHPEKSSIALVPAPLLSLEFQLLSGSPREKSLQRMFFPDSYTPIFRTLISANNNFAFVQEFSGFHPEKDGLFGYVVTDSFPRDSPRWRVRLEQRSAPDSHDWRELASFEIKNPKPLLAPLLQANSSSHFQLQPSLGVDIGELVIRHQPFRGDVGEYTADLALRVTTNGNFASKWGIADDFILDASGDPTSFPPQDSETSNEWVIYHITRPPDPNCPWNFHLHLSQSSDFSASNLYTIALVWPISAMHTNLGGFDVSIEEAAAGIIGSQMDFGVNVQLTNKPQGMRLSFIDAVDDAGRHLSNYPLWPYPSWPKQDRFQEILMPIKEKTRFYVTVAIHPDYPVDFTLVPRLEKSAISSRPKTSGH